MSAPFPLTPAPAAYAQITGSTRGNVYVDGESPSFTFNKTVTGTWLVRDFWGATVTTGSLTAQSSLIPTAPAGGWVRGWYRLYLIGSTNDAVFGFSLGVTNFSVVANDAHFTPRPARNDAPFVTSFQGEAPDLPLKGFLGLGTSRLIIANAAAPTAGFSDTLDSVTQGLAQSNTYWTTGGSFAGADTARPRLTFVAFPNDSTDHAFIDNGNSKLIVSFLSGPVAAVGSIAIVTAAGTSSGIKLTFTQGATVETYDNCVATITGVLQRLAAVPSALVAVYRYDDRGSGDAIVAGVNVTLTNAKYLGVKLVAQTCYPLGAKWYAGPLNEPDLRKNPVRYAHDALMFRAAVKAGNAAALVMGPGVVTITPGPGEDPTVQSNALGSMYRWLVGGVAADGTSAGTVAAIDGPNRAGKDYIDGIMVHVYNFMVLDLFAGYTTLANFERVLTLAGVQALPRFQGELGMMTPVYGVYHPRRSHMQVSQHLMLERYGMPMERNNLWYDISHGFWSFPGWWENEDQSINPAAHMLRVMAEETYSRPYSAPVDFGTGVGSQLFIGNLYVGSDGTKVIGMKASSHLDNATVVLQLAGTIPGTITWRTGFGITSTVTVGAGNRVEVPITGEPTWVRLPNGCTATVYTFLGMANKDVPNLAGRNSWATWDGSAGTRQAVNQAGQTGYDGSNTELSIRAAPANMTIRFWRDVYVTDVIVFAGMVWQAQSTLTDFDVQTSTDGGLTWVTRQTYTKIPTTFVHGANSVNTGTQRESFWDEQWVIPVHLTTGVTCNAIRLVIRSTSYGGEPDAASVAAGGQGDSNQNVTITEVYVLDGGTVTTTVP